MEENKKGANTLYAVIGIATLVVAIIGATFAYFSASQTNSDITGTTAEAGGLTIEAKLITDNIESVKKNGSAITTAVVKETILVVNEGTATINYVPSRKNSRVARAPQSFWLNDILNAHEKALSEGKKDYIDSCTMMQEYGYDLFLVDGPGENIKITTPEDFYIMRAILEAKENAQIYGFDE